MAEVYTEKSTHKSATNWVLFAVVAALIIAVIYALMR